LRVAFGTDSSWQINNYLQISGQFEETGLPFKLNSDVTLYIGASSVATGGGAGD
jgi:hypothetical protein